MAVSKLSMVEPVTYAMRLSWNIVIIQVCAELLFRSGYDRERIGKQAGEGEETVCNQGIKTEKAIYSWTLLDQFKH